MYVLEETDWAAYFPKDTHINVHSDMYNADFSNNYRNHVWNEDTYRVSGTDEFTVEERLKMLSEFFDGKPLADIPGLEVYLSNTYSMDSETAHMEQLVLKDGKWKYSHHVTEWVECIDQTNSYDMSIVA